MEKAHGSGCMIDEGSCGAAHVVTRDTRRRIYSQEACLFPLTRLLHLLVDSSLLLRLSPPLATALLPTLTPSPSLSSLPPSLLSACAGTPSPLDASPVLSLACDQANRVTLRVKRRGKREEKFNRRSCERRQQERERGCTRAHAARLPPLPFPPPFLSPLFLFSHTEPCMPT